MFKKVIGIRVDVDTATGLKKGVPKLLKIFKQYDVSATFYIVMGPDSMGRHIFRFRKKDYIKRIIRVNPIKLISKYGIIPFFYGTIVRKPPLVAGSAPDMIKQILAAGHEIGLHSYNHANWADKHEQFDLEHVQTEFKKANLEYKKLTGRKPLSSACPNWRCSEKILIEEDKLGFIYLSDTRGEYPFFPITSRGVMKTLQIPQTMPTFHEYLQLGIYNRANVVDGILKELNEFKLNVFTLHDWFEGMSYPDLADEFFEKTTERGYEFKSLYDCARILLRNIDEIPINRISLKSIPGGIGQVTCQEVN